MGCAPKEVIELIEQFERNIESYKGQGYSEAQVRQQFINPFFEALGWDMQNKAGIAPAYSDVIHEDAIKVGGTTKAPDYCFRIGGTRKFFLEAKKPSVDIKSDISPAYQLRRYAWSAKLPLSILTDFEEFAVYDCQIRPSPDDKPSTGRIMLFTYKDYADKWEQIAKIFSKEAVYKGLFDKYASEKTTKRGTTTVDKEFLAEIEQWRNVLAKNIAIRNGKLSVYDLNFAVQKTIDRILFLRICEDRGIERSEQLLGLISGSRIYPRLFELFERADEKYNSGIFHFRREKDRPEGPDELSANLKIDDDVLTQILKDLYYPRSPYEFSVMPAEILGQVYEQFLGKVIRLTESHQAKVEEKPEVKKAGGVYYTPSYIVDYIVKNTVGKLCENKTPKQVEKLKILDPACGSGSFLIGAYRYLLDFHRDYYAKEPSKHKRVIYQGKGKQWFLTIDEKKRILLNNIYGVDIDSQAAEVTKLSLLLKVLENETQESLRLFHERALPDLGNNIKCGNSLIGNDFYQNQQRDLFGEEEKHKINAFDWQKEFSPILKQGGFDAVIGNPPWGATFSEIELEYLKSSFLTPLGKNVDSYTLFIERALTKVRKQGLVSYITPDTFLRKDDHEKLREFVLKNITIQELIETGPVFAQVPDTWCLVFSFLKENPNQQSKIKHKKISRFIVNAQERLRKFGLLSWDVESNIKQTTWLTSQHSIVGYRASELEQRIIRKMEKQPPLSNHDNRFLISRGEEGSKFSLSSSSDGNFWMVIPADISRYCTPHGIRIQSDTLKPTKISDFYNHPKIWIIRIQKLRWKQRLVTSIDFRNNSSGMKTLQLIVSVSDDLPDLLFLQGILSSSLINFWCTNYLADDMNKSYLEKIPIPEPNHQLSVLSEQMLELHKKLSKIKNPDEKTRIQRQIDSTNEQIDKLVYDLYGLSADEIAIVEGKERGEKESAG
jgi:type I restriction-modification system DNA methylase subunit